VVMLEQQSCKHKQLLGAMAGQPTHLRQGEEIMSARETPNLIQSDQAQESEERLGQDMEKGHKLTAVLREMDG